MRARFTGSQERDRVEPAHLAERRGRPRRWFGFHLPHRARNAWRQRLQFDDEGRRVRLTRAIGTPDKFRVAFHAGEHLHFVTMVDRFRGTTEAQRRMTDTEGDLQRQTAVIPFR